MIQAAEMSDIKCLEHHTLKVPYEVLNKRFRATQKVFDREASHVQQTAADLEKVSRWLPRNMNKNTMYYVKYLEEVLVFQNNFY